tara:strand:+ start:1444 stop:1740 length:297 start_codon:yes stop_codon:yes gene_type:complete
LDIKSSSIALQNYFTQKDLQFPSEKKLDSDNFDDSIIENMNHFKLESPLSKKQEPEMLSEAEQESLNLLFSDKPSTYQERYQLRLHSNPIGTFLDVKG